MPLDRFRTNGSRFVFDRHGPWMLAANVRPLLELTREIHRIRSLSADYEPTADECEKLDELLQRCVPLL